MKKTFLFAAALLLSCICGLAKVKLPGVISSNMILQQQSDASIWGWADPNATVTVSASWGASVTVSADRNGAWKAALRTPAASYDKYTVTITSGETVQLDNILVGEVWIGSGQSNIEMPLKGFGNCPVENSSEEILLANRFKDKIHYVRLPITEDAYTPREDASCRWTELNLGTAEHMSAVGYYFCKMMNAVLDVPVGFIACYRGGSRVEGWLPEDVLKVYGEPLDAESIRNTDPVWNKPMVYYNGMLNPIRHYTVKGFLWYQGEGNVSAWPQYAERLTKMIGIWRGLWQKEDLPFYIAEIAPFDGYGKLGGARLREAQWQVADAVENCWAISTNDLVEPYEFHQIHPKDKKDVGYRLAWASLNKTYGVSAAPVNYLRFKSLTINGSKAIVELDYMKGYGFNRSNGITGFEVCGADGVFHPAQAVIRNDKVEVTSPEVPSPIHVRYCFQDFLIGNLKSTQGLPLVPFRTDSNNDR